jgi:hypothetical protein
MQYSICAVIEATAEIDDARIVHGIFDLYKPMHRQIPETGAAVAPSIARSGIHLGMGLAFKSLESDSHSTHAKETVPCPVVTKAF